MKSKALIVVSFIIFVLLPSKTMRRSLSASAQEIQGTHAGSSQPTIPPTLSSVRPAGLPRGSTKTFTVEGRNLTGANLVLFDRPGISAKVRQVVDLPEETRKARPGVDLAAIVAQGRKQQATLEVSVSRDAEPGIHSFRIETPLGTSNLGVFDVGEFPEAQSNHSAAEVPLVVLPATLVGTIAKPGDVDTYQFQGRAGEELVFQTVASQLTSRLNSLLVLGNATGQVLAKAGAPSRQPDSVLTFKLPSDGKYTISISDRNREGGAGYFYRLNAGVFPYLTGVFPLGVRAGEPADVAVEGVNMSGVQRVKVDPPKRADGWTTVPLRIKTPKGETLNKLELAAGNDPEVLEKEPNDTPAKAQLITVPVAIEGRIWSERKDGPADEDYFRFHARKGERFTMEVAAARLGSPLDSLIEVLDDQGRAIPRATVRCLNQTVLTLADRDSLTRGYRLMSKSGFHENDYIMVGEELDQIAYIPDQPDADILLKGFGGRRVALLGTSPEAHAVNEPVYRVQILEPGAKFPPNGLPVFEITYRNDDGGPRYGADSRLEFTAPHDGDYIVHLKDVRGLQGPDFAYRLGISELRPDFRLVVVPANPNVPRGGRLPLTVSADRYLGYDGPIEIEVKGLPKGLNATPAVIAAGENATVVILEAASDAPELQVPANFQVIGKGRVGDRDLVRTTESSPLQVVSLMPPPDLYVQVEPKEIILEPGQSAKVTLRVERRNGFEGRVPCNLQNLPPGVRVVNVGLNGVLVPEHETTRTFTVKAEDWATSIDQPAYVVAAVESNASTYHASPPLMIKVRSKQVARAAAGETR